MKRSKKTTVLRSHQNEINETRRSAQEAMPISIVMAFQIKDRIHNGKDAHYRGFAH